MKVAAPGFEDGSSAKNKKYKSGKTVAGGWTVTSGTVHTMGNNSVTGIEATEGSRYVDLNGSGPGAISQEVDVTKGSTHTLTLDVAAKTGGSTPRTAEVIWDGKVVATIELKPGSDWTTLKIELPAPSTTPTTLTLKATSTGGSGVYVDNIKVD